MRKQGVSLTKSCIYKDHSAGSAVTKPEKNGHEAFIWEATAVSPRPANTQYSNLIFRTCATVTN